MTPYLLVLGGTMFMSATDEELRHADDLGIDHVTYALFVFSLSFLLFLHMTFLIHLYSHSGRNAVSNLAKELVAREEGYQSLRLRESPEGPIDGPESFELAEHDSSERFDGTTLNTGRESDEDAKEFIISDGRDSDEWGRSGVRG